MFLESSKPISGKCIYLGTLQLNFILRESDDAVDRTWNNLIAFVICSLLEKNNWFTNISVTLHLSGSCD